MGNAQPVPSNLPAGRQSAGTGHQHPNNNNNSSNSNNERGGSLGIGAPPKLPKPPNGWSKESDKQDFMLISPQSDLSNPSQFRHRHDRHHPAPAVQSKTPILDRKRTSKVMSKGEIPTSRHQTYVRSNTLPAPTAFYFERNIQNGEDNDDDNDNDESRQAGRRRSQTPPPRRHRRAASGAAANGGGKENNNRALVTNNNNNKNHHHRRLRPALINNTRRCAGGVAVVKIKAGRAKRILKGCWDEQIMHSACLQPYVNDNKQTESVVVPEVTRKSSNVVAADPVIDVSASHNSSNNNNISNTTHQGGVPKQVSFEPKLQQEKTTDVGNSRTYLHDQKGYVDRLATADKNPHVATPVAPAVMDKPKPTKNLLGSTPAHQQDGVDSPVSSALFDLKEKYKAAARKSSSSAPSSSSARRDDSPAKPKKKSSSNAAGDDDMAKQSKKSSSNADDDDTKRASVSQAIQAQIDTQLQRSKSQTSNRTSSTSTTSKNHRAPLAEKKSNNNNKSSTRDRLSSRGDGESSSSRGRRLSGPSSLICRSKAVDHEHEAQLKQQEQKQQQSQCKENTKSETRRVSFDDQPEKHSESPTTNSSTGVSSRFPKLPINGELLEGSEKENFQTGVGAKVNDPRASLATCNSLTGASVKDMLVQTYPIANEFADPRIRYSTARYLTGNHSKAGTDPAYSPYVSGDDSRLTPKGGKSPKPVLSEQVTSNAAFLFSPGYYAGTTAHELIQPAPRNENSSVSISTKDSRYRLSGWSSSQSRPATIPISIDEASMESDRRVRFSDSDQVFTLSKESENKYSSLLQQQQKKSPDDHVVYIPPIESKLSDLTDTTGHPTNGRRESIVSIATASTYSSKVPSIPEETSTAAYDEDDDNTDIGTSPSSYGSSCATKKSSPPPCQDTGKEESPAQASHSSDNDSTHLQISECCKASYQELPPKKNWSYAGGNNSMDNGVTPLRSGKSSYNATNSPVLRFKEAKKRFAGGKNNASPAKKVQPTKRPAPSAKKICTGLVQKRVVAMEEKVLDVQMTTRRDTIGHRVLAPRKGSLVSSAFRPVPQAYASSSVKPATVEQPKHAAVSGATLSTAIDVKAKSKLPLRRSSTTVNVGTGYDSDDKDDDDATDDEFGQIRASNPINEEGSSDDDEEAARDILQDVLVAKATVASVRSSDCETDDDDFAALLHYESSPMDGDEDSGGDGEETVSTVRQQQPRRIDYNMLHRRSSNVSSQRSSFGSKSSYGSTSAGPSVATVRQNRQSLVSTGESTTLSRALKKEKLGLPFREETLVKPNEQNHRAAPGELCLSPMQRTPMQARKWRALAAAAQEKESKQRNFGGGGGGKGSKAVVVGRGRARKSLSERSNTMHNMY